MIKRSKERGRFEKKRRWEKERKKKKEKKKRWEEKKKWWEGENGRLKKKKEEKKWWWEEKILRNVTRYALVLSRCVWTKTNVTHCDWFSLDVFGPNLMWPVVPLFCPYVFGPNLMWLVVIGSVLMCLDQSWCDLIVVKNLKYSRKNSIIQERDWHLKRKSRILKF